ncbi:mucin-19-like isoform X5 [Ctenopharyngodon idella]|uniref:mucin-19-like isoform X5 n=1 Tax=Ctenopharyngodon idella TaxID=7959 RepID=UPI002231F102|nr:mucin-19-like isoform X5 [Ctenopharyngodon idella]
MFGFWSIQGFFLFAMDQGWKRLPLLVVFLFLSSAYGFKGGAYSNAHQRWGQPSDNTFSPHAVQSSVSEVPVTGTLPEEVGSSLFTNRPLKRFNLLQFVKGHDSSHHESMSYAQTAPSSSVFASLPLPLSEKQAGSLTLLQGSGTTITDTASVSTQSTSGQSTSDQSFPSLYMSSSQETSGVESAEAALPVFSQESISYSSSSAPGATYTSQGSPVPLSEGSSQAISPQDESSYSRLFQSQGASSHYTPDSYTKLSSSSVSSQSTSDQSPPSLYSSSSQDSSGSLLEASGSFFQGEMVGLSSSDLSPESQTSGQLLPSSLEVSSQFTNGQGSPSLFIGSSKSSSDSQSTGPASLLDTQGSLSQSILSTQTQGSTSQGSAGPELSGSSGQFIPTQVEGGSYSVSQSLNSSPYAPGSLMYGKFGPLPIRVSSQSTSTQSSPGTPLTSSRFPVQGGSSSTSSLYLKPQGTLGLYAPASSTKYVSVPMPQRAVYSQATSGSGALFGTSIGLASQGMSSTYSGSVQPQGTTSQFAPGSPSFSSSQKQFTSSYGTQSRPSLPLTLQGSATYGGSLQAQGTTGQFAPGSPSSGVSLSSAQGAASQPATVPSSRKQFTSSSGTQSGSSLPLTLQGSTTYGGSLQPQGTASQFAPGSPSSYPSVSLSSPQGAASQSATVLSSRKQFTSSYGTQTGSSLPLTLQGGAAYGGSLQPQGTASQFAPGSPSSYPSVSLSSPQGAASQSATVLSSRKQFTSSSGTQSGSSLPLTLQGSTTYGGSLQPQGTASQFAPGSPSSYPSVSLSSPQGAASQSATVLSSRKQFTSSSGTQSGSSLPLALQGSPTYGGSLQPQGTASQLAPGSPSSYPSVFLSSPQGVASQPSQAFQSYSVSQSQKSQRWQPSQGIQTSGAAVSQGIDLSQSSPMQSRFSSLSSAGGPSSKDSGLFVSAQGGGTSYGGFSLNSQSPLKYNPGSHAYAKFGSSPLAVSSQSTSDQHSNGLYSSGSLQTQGLLGVVEGPSSQAPFDSPSSNQIERFVMLQRPTGSNLAPSLGLSAQASSVSMLSGVPQTAQALRESGSDVQLNNQVSSNSQANAYTSLQKFSSNYGAQSLKPSELLRYEPGVYGQGTSSASELLSSYGSTYNLNAPASIPSRSSLSSRYYSVKG